MRRQATACRRWRDFAPLFAKSEKCCYSRRSASLQVDPVSAYNSKQISGFSDIGAL